VGRPKRSSRHNINGESGCAIARQCRDDGAILGVKSFGARESSAASFAASSDGSWKIQVGEPVT
jgi:hypothetical protein